MKEPWKNRQIKYIKHELGRGWVIICDDQNFKVGEKIILEITGIDKHSTNGNIVGLLLKDEIKKPTPNEHVDEESKK